MSTLARIAQLHRELADAYEQLEQERADAWVDQHESPLGSRQHIRLVRTGVLEGSRVGKRYLVRQSVIDAYLAKFRVEPNVGPDAEPAPCQAEAVRKAVAELGLVPRRKDSRRVA